MHVSRRALGSVALASALVLTGCSSTSGKKDAKAPSGSGAAPTASQRLAEARKVLDTTAGYHFKLQGTDVPKSSSGVLSGEGDVIAKPAFKGSLNVQAGSLSASVPVISIDGKTYAKMPFSAKMTTINPKTYGAPDPNLLFSKNDGISTLLPATTKATFGDSLRDGKDVVRAISGELPGAIVKKVLNMGDGTGTFDVQYNLTENNEVRSARVVGPFFAGATSTYNLTFTDFGKTVDIQAP